MIDIEAFLSRSKGTKPPYTCPVADCAKIYKSYSGFECHLNRHKTDTSNSSSTSPMKTGPIGEPFSYAEAQRIVEIQWEGKVQRLNIYEPLEKIVKEDVPSKKAKTQKGATESKTKIHLPDAKYRILDNYPKPKLAPPRSKDYFKYVEKSDKANDVEYDMDDEDYAWLEIMNKKRKDLKKVSQDVFEMLMDSFEKEAFFQTNGSPDTPEQSGVDDDAVCAVCMDGECHNANVILFCDICNLAVHQECYGVPYVPEGQWLCRRCFKSPSKAVNCCLCPNQGGAFKETVDKKWAHVVCAIWIPEVCFANTVFLEPIDGIDNIPQARWRLTCYICKQRGVGACIQCHKANCYTAFHVTCALQAGLYMRMMPAERVGLAQSEIKKYAYCDAHCPAEVKGSSEGDSQKRLRIKRARKLLAERRNKRPPISVPVISADRLQELSKEVKKSEISDNFVERLYAYWTLKRQSRYGVPLLRRLQNTNNYSGQARSDQGQSGSDERTEMLKTQFYFWRRLREDLERARLLLELIRKREKLKREQLQAQQQVSRWRLEPWKRILHHTLRCLSSLDTAGHFAKPVNAAAVPGYTDVVAEPMDFETMQRKIDEDRYGTVHDFERDFRLICDNCMKFNPKNSVFYRSAMQLKERGQSLIDRLNEEADDVLKFFSVSC